jgi:putative peptidoglycan lipid II flippase
VTGDPGEGAPPAEDWSAPAIYSAGQPLAGRTFVEADPISAVLFSVDDAADAEAGADRRVMDAAPAASEPHWSATTYVGRRRHRPARGPTPAGRPAAPVQTSPALAPSDRGLLSSSKTMAIASVVSRLTGFLRSVLVVAALGTGAVGNAYNGGNTFPNMVYELLLGGVLSSVLIPLLVHAQELDDDDGVAYAQRLLSLATVALGVLTLVAVAAAPWIAGVFVPAGSQRELTTIFATLLLPEIFFYGLGAMFMAVLNIRHVYGPGAWAPVLNNVIMIATILLFWLLPGPTTLDPATMTTPQILVLGIGTTLGIAAQALVLVPSLRRAGFRWRWRFRAYPNELGRMKEVGTLAGWVFVYVIASQVGVSVIQKVGFSNGGLTVFTQADLLFQVPYGILVVSLLTAIMPRLSRAAVRGDTAAVVADLSLGARLSAIALVPVTVGLIVLGQPLCYTLFAHGHTTPDGARLSGTALALSAFGLLPFAVVMLQLRVFYAMRDGKTPALINAFMVAAKVGLVLLTSYLFRARAGTDVNVHPPVRAVEWLNISTSLSYVVGAAVGHLVLTRRLGHLGFRAVAATTARMALASVVAGAAAWASVIGAEHWLGRGAPGEAVALVAGALIGAAVLVILVLQLRIPEVDELRAGLRRR